MFSNKLVVDTEKQNSEKTGGIFDWKFGSEITCKELIKNNSYNMVYISKKQDIYDTRFGEPEKRNCSLNALVEELETIIKDCFSSKDNLTIKCESYYYAEKIIQKYSETGDKRKAMKTIVDFLEKEKNGSGLSKKGNKDYAVIINTIPDKQIKKSDEVIAVSSIDSIKGQEGENCLFILTVDLAAYLFGDKTEDNKVKNLLYVALTRSLDKLTVYITEDVEKKYGKDKIHDFFESILKKWEIST